MGGVCECDPGYGGLDCVQAGIPPLAPAAARPSVAVFVYDLPADLGLTSFALRTWGIRGVRSALRKDGLC